MEIQGKIECSKNVLEEKRVPDKMMNVIKEVVSGYATQVGGEQEKGKFWRGMR